MVAVNSRPVSGLTGFRIDRLPMLQTQWLNDPYNLITVAGAALVSHQLPDYPPARHLVSKWWGDTKPNRRAGKMLIG
jgi:hypothetical protein